MMEIKTRYIQDTTRHILQRYTNTAILTFFPDSNLSGYEFSMTLQLNWASFHMNLPQIYTVDKVHLYSQ